MSEPKQCCALCGFLVRRNVKTGTLEPCTQEHRGWMGFDPYDGEGMPHCGKLQQDLEAEWRPQLERLRADPSHGGNVHRAAVSAVTYHERVCDAFRPWDPLLSPKEHEEMAFAERIRTLHQQQRTEDLARQKEFWDSQQNWQKKIDTRTRRAHWLAVIALIVSAIAVAAVGFLSSWLVSSLMQPK